MARPEIEPKTELGRRLREIRAHFKVEEREAFAARLGISKQALANYERGERVPDASVLEAYRATYGVNLNWLLSGAGDMIEATPASADGGIAPAAPADDQRRPTTDLNIALLQRLSDLVESVFAESGQALPNRAITGEAGKLYAELSRTIYDLADEEVVEAVLPVLRGRLKKRVLEAAGEPGSGKRSA